MDKKLVLGISFLVFLVVGGAGGYYVKNNTDLLETTGINDMLGLSSTTPVKTNNGSTNTGSTTQTGSTSTGTQISTEYKNEYLLVAGFPASAENKNTMVALINPSVNTINYIPFNYFTGVEGKETLAYMSIDEIQTYFTDLGINFIGSGTYLDQNDVFKVYMQNISTTPNAYIEIVDKNGQAKEFPVASKDALYRLIRDYASDPYVQEQILHNILTKYIIPTDARFAILDETGDRKLLEESFTGTPYYLTTEEKGFAKKVIQKNGTWISSFLDEENKYIKTLVSGDFDLYEPKVKMTSGTGSTVNTGSGKTNTGSTVNTGSGKTNTGSTTSTNTGTTTPEKKLSVKERLELQKKQESVTNTGTTTPEKKLSIKERLELQKKQGQ